MESHEGDHSEGRHLEADHDEGKHLEECEQREVDQRYVQEDFAQESIDMENSGDKTRHAPEEGISNDLHCPRDASSKSPELDESGAAYSAGSGRGQHFLHRRGAESLAASLQTGRHLVTIPESPERLDRSSQDINSPAIVRASSFTSENKIQVGESSVDGDSFVPTDCQSTRVISQDNSDNSNESSANLSNNLSKQDSWKSNVDAKLDRQGVVGRSEGDRELGAPDEAARLDTEIMKTIELMEAIENVISGNSTEERANLGKATNKGKEDKEMAYHSNQTNQIQAKSTKSIKAEPSVSQDGCKMFPRGGQDIPEENRDNHQTGDETKQNGPLIKIQQSEDPARGQQEVGTFSSQTHRQDYRQAQAEGENEQLISDQQEADPASGTSTCTLLLESEQSNIITRVQERNHKREKKQVSKSRKAGKSEVTVDPSEQDQKRGKKDHEMKEKHTSSVPEFSHHKPRLGLRYNENSSKLKTSLRVQESPLGHPIKQEANFGSEKKVQKEENYTSRDKTKSAPSDWRSLRRFEVDPEETKRSATRAHRPALRRMKGRIGEGDDTSLSDLIRIKPPAVQQVAEGDDDVQNDNEVKTRERSSEACGAVYRGSKTTESDSERGPGTGCRTVLHQVAPTTQFYKTAASATQTRSARGTRLWKVLKEWTPLGKLASISAIDRFYRDDLDIVYSLVEFISNLALAVMDFIIGQSAVDCLDFTAAKGVVVIRNHAISWMDTATYQKLTAVLSDFLCHWWLGRSILGMTSCCSGAALRVLSAVDKTYIILGLTGERRTRTSSVRQQGLIKLTVRAWCFPVWAYVYFWTTFLLFLNSSLLYLRDDALNAILTRRTTKALQQAMLAEQQRKEEWAGGHNHRRHEPGGQRQRSDGHWNLEWQDRDQSTGWLDISGGDVIFTSEMTGIKDGEERGDGYEGSVRREVRQGEGDGDWGDGRRYAGKRQDADIRNDRKCSEGKRGSESNGRVEGKEDEMNREFQGKRRQRQKKRRYIRGNSCPYQRGHSKNDQTKFSLKQNKQKIEKLSIHKGKEIESVSSLHGANIGRSPPAMRKKQPAKKQGEIKSLTHTHKTSGLNHELLKAHSKKNVKGKGNSGSSPQKVITRRQKMTSTSQTTSCKGVDKGRMTSTPHKISCKDVVIGQLSIGQQIEDLGIDANNDDVMIISIQDNTRKVHFTKKSREIQDQRSVVYQTTDLNCSTAPQRKLKQREKTAPRRVKKFHHSTMMFPSHLQGCRTSTSTWSPAEKLAGDDLTCDFGFEMVDRKVTPGKRRLSAAKRAPSPFHLVVPPGCPVSPGFGDLSLGNQFLCLLRKLPWLKDIVRDPRDPPPLSYALDVPTLITDDKMRRLLELAPKRRTTQHPKRKLDDLYPEEKYDSDDDPDYEPEEDCTTDPLEYSEEEAAGVSEREDYTFPGNIMHTQPEETQSDGDDSDYELTNGYQAT